MARRRGRRGLDDEEARLWRTVTDAVTPLETKSPGTLAGLKATTSAGGQMPDAPAWPPKKLTKKGTSKPSLSPGRTADSIMPLPVARHPAPHDPGSIDGGLQRKLRRGRIEPDAKIDLHGLTQAQAHQRLRAEVPRLKASGARCLLVVTGKGSATSLTRHTLHGSDISHTPERRGVLRDSLPHWLADAEFRPHVAAVRPAHPRHGGGGAFYVWLRRQR